MSDTPAVGDAAGAGALPGPLRIRRAQLGDLGTLVRLYRGQSPASRALHHPYPFDRTRLTVILLLLLLSNRFVRGMLRTAPNYAFVVLIAEGGDAGDALAFGTIRFVAHPPEPIWARFGYLVRDDSQGRGVGSRLAIALYRTSVALGVHRGGGTVLEGNVASQRVVQRFGFRLAQSASPDPAAPTRRNLASVEDLDAVLAGIRARGGWTPDLDADLPE